MRQNKSWSRFIVFPFGEKGARPSYHNPALQECGRYGFADAWEIMSQTGALSPHETQKLHWAHLDIDGSAGVPLHAAVRKCVKSIGYVLVCERNFDYLKKDF